MEAGFAQKEQNGGEKLEGFPGKGEEARGQKKKRKTSSHAGLTDWGTTGGKGS